MTQNMYTCVSYEAIYKFAYSADGQAIKLWQPERLRDRDRGMPDAVTVAALTPP